MTTTITRTGSQRLSSRWSQARARLQSRRTVATETSRTSAISLWLNPPKNRISITRLLRGSSASRAFSASSNATRSAFRATGTFAASDRDT